MISKIINSIMIIAFSYIFLKLIQYILHRIFKITRFDIRYENTLCSVLLSVSYYIVFSVCLILILKRISDNGYYKVWILSYRC